MTSKGNSENCSGKNKNMRNANRIDPKLRMLLKIDMLEIINFKKSFTSILNGFVSKHLL